MEQRTIGYSGLRVSLLGLGCNNFGRRLDLGASRRVVFRALDVGVNLFDTADFYGRGASESLLGDVLGDQRKNVVLATKFGMAMDEEGKLSGASRNYIMSAVEASLTRLRTDWIDLYQLHTPDPRTPIEETLRALDDLKSQGKVRHIGCSNLSAAAVVEAGDVAAARGLMQFISCQDEYNLFSRGLERDLLRVMTERGLGLLPYRPLASGFLTGKYRRDTPMPQGARLSGAAMKRLADRFLTRENFAKLDQLDTLARNIGRSLIDIALGWLASKSYVPSIIAGASTPEQVDANLQAVTCNLGHEEVAAIEALVDGRPTGPPDGTGRNDGDRA
jgi:aryl-alcohol dehydrogenase-like predicted oxidoreductase